MTTEKPKIATDAAEGPNKNQGQNKFFNNTFAPGSMDAVAVALRTTVHDASPRSLPLQMRTHDCNGKKAPESVLY